MKLKTSYCNRTVLRKDVSRFAPLWALYAVFMLMVFFPVYTSTDPYIMIHDLTSLMQPMAVFNLIYALICAQLLFGDLFQARLCHALHAFPLRREGWFLTHVLAGLLFSLVPNLLLCCTLLPLLGEFWYLAFGWLAASSLQFLCFFGLAVLSAFLTGNRLAMVLIYGLMNFLSLFVYWLINTLIIPLLYGINLNETSFLWYSPVFGLSVNIHYFTVSREFTSILPSNEITSQVISVSSSGDWWYALLCAGLGIFSLIGALLLYRHRKLECAGDFMAFRQLEPLFILLFSISAGTLFQMFGSIFVGTSSNDLLNLFLALGLTSGYITGHMLTHRTLRVFRPRLFAGLAVLLSSAALVLGFFYLDLAGIARWVPDQDTVDSVTLWNGEYQSSDEWIRLTDPADIEAVTAMHRSIVQDISAYKKSLERLPSTTEMETSTGVISFNTQIMVSLRYALTDGRTANRYYEIIVDSENGQLLRHYFSQPEFILGEEIQDQAAYLSSLSSVYLEDGTLIAKEDWPVLLDVILQDCSDGSMAQNWAFHAEEEPLIWLDLTFQPESPDGGYNDDNRCIAIYPCCVHTIDFLQKYGY